MTDSELLTYTIKLLRQKRDNAYALYSIHRDHTKSTYTVANEQYFMGKWHVLCDLVHQVEQVNVG